MSKIELRWYQKEAVQFSLKVSHSLLLMEAGTGKTLLSLFLARLLLKKDLTDKVLISATVNACNAFLLDGKDKFNFDIFFIDKIEDLEFFIKDNKHKVAIFKHSFFIEMGFIENNINLIKKLLTKDYKRISLIIDEAHEMNNTSGQLHQAYNNIKFMLERVCVMTATPYSSCLTQLYGLVCLIQPKLWKNIYEFKSLFIEEKKVKNWKTGKYHPEKQAYKNLKLLREQISPFTYFYFPKVKLNFTEYKIELKNYEEYNNIARGLLNKKDLDKLDSKNNGDN